MMVDGGVFAQPAGDFIWSRQAGYFNWLCEQFAKGEAKDVTKTVLSSDDLKVIVEIVEYRKTDQDQEVREASLGNGQ
jgi:hypothetical protein